MKKLVAYSGAILLAACSQAEAPADTEADTTSVAETATVEGAGTFDYASEDGSLSGQVVMNEDGTYTDNQVGQEPTTGTWALKDGKTCFTDSAEGAEEVCWTDGEPDADGSFISTSPDGVTVKVSEAADDAAAEGDAMEDGEG
ncbi:hypothetical protein [Altererythrobacter sp.]|uniref:hypothetical protein n=1 Tax=Altererythrobacter sp. TaxID=1872480 RepID=UPI003CFEE0B8